VVSETTLAREIFGPLWTIIDKGAVVAAGPEGTEGLQDVSSAAFVNSRRDEISQIIDTVRALGDFQDSTMEIFEQARWQTRHAPDELTVHLLLWSGGIESYPPDIDDPHVVRRLVDTAADLQLVAFLNAMVGAALVRGPGTAPGAELVAPAVTSAVALLGRDAAPGGRDVFRMWRVASLPSVLRPDSGVEESVKQQWRSYERGLEPLLLRP
jgi:hypothetical protein